MKATINEHFDFHLKGSKGFILIKDSKVMNKEIIKYGIYNE